MLTLYFSRYSTKNVKLLTDDPQPTTIDYPSDSSDSSDLKKFTECPYVSSTNKSLSPCPIDSKFHILKRGHYGHISNAFKLSSTSVKVQKKLLQQCIQFYYVAILVLPRGHAFHNLGRALHGHHIHAFSLSLFAMKVKKN